MTSHAAPKIRTYKYKPKVRILYRQPEWGPAEYVFVWREPRLEPRVQNGRLLKASNRRRKRLFFINSESANEWMALKVADLKRKYDGVILQTLPRVVRGPEDE